MEGIYADVSEYIIHVQDEKRRNIVFIASCFGGLLLAKVSHPVWYLMAGRRDKANRKKALTMAAAGYSRHQGILDATVGVLCLGTPFRGSRGTLPGQFRVFVARAITGDATNRLLSVLDSSSGTLDDLTHSFSQMMRFHHIPMTCVYETEHCSLEEHYSWWSVQVCSDGHAESGSVHENCGTF